MSQLHQIQMFVYCLLLLVSDYLGKKLILLLQIRVDFLNSRLFQ